MSVRFVAAFALSLAVTSPIAAAPPKPALVLQGQPLGRLIGDLKEIVRLTAAPGQDEAAVTAFVKSLEDAVGQKGFEGIDLNRPLALYVTMREKQDDHTVTLVVPITGEKEFLDLIDRAGAEVKAVEGKKGLFGLELPAAIFPHDSYVRIADGWAYLGFNGEDVADAVNLVPVAELMDPRETAQLALRLYPERVPIPWLRRTLDEIQNDLTAFKQFIPIEEKATKKAMDALIDEGLKLLRRTAESLHTDASLVTLRFTFDVGTGDTATEFVVTPKPGTPLAKDVSARPPTTNRFAGLVPPDAAIGYAGQWPLFSAESRAIAEADLEMNLADLKKEVPDLAHPALDELFKGLIRATKAGDGDYAMALCGPNKDGLFTAVAALSCDDAGATEKALRALAAKLPVKVVALDVDKAEGVSIHRVMVPLEDADKDVQKVFGKTAALCVAFGPKAVYVAFGADALEKAKAALGAKGGPAPVVSLSGNPSRVAKLAGATAGPKGEKFAASLLGTEGKSRDALTVTLTGGAELTLRVSLNVKYLPRLLVNAEGDAVDKP
ncbi:MAG TPA: hypothetical protein VMZ71_12165 [Gemmataceae bacterium]|nr:hypothetical protein [Gemmataceae bacterium]